MLAIHGLVQRGPGWPAFTELVLSFTSQRADAALSSWTSEDRDRIAVVARIDLVFGLLYASLLALAAIWVARARPASPSGRGSDLAWLSSLIAVLDVPENVAYLSMVRGHVDQPWPAIAGACVVVRTALLLTVLTVVVRTPSAARSA
jgi:hypothetical protein